MNNIPYQKFTVLDNNIPIKEEEIFQSHCKNGVLTIPAPVMNAIGWEPSTKVEITATPRILVLKQHYRGFEIKQKTTDSKTCYLPIMRLSKELNKLANNDEFFPSGNCSITVDYENNKLIIKQKKETTYENSNQQWSVHYQIRRKDGNFTQTRKV